MNERIIDAIDAVLTVLFWLPAKILHVKKCQRCTIRYRWYQFVHWLTGPLDGWTVIQDRRVTWELVLLTFDNTPTNFARVDLPPPCPQDVPKPPPPPLRTYEPNPMDRRTK